MEANAKLFVQRLRIVANNVKPAAFSWALWPERADDHMPSAFDGLGHLTDIRYALVHRCKKMKDCPVMPNVVRIWLQLRARDIADEPTDIF